MIIGILGNKGHGKDTVADYLVEKYNYNKYSFAKPIKDICKIIFGFTEDQLYTNKKEIIDKYWNITPRKAMEFIGTDLFRYRMNELIPDIKDNIWVKHFSKYILNNNLNKNIVIADIRFQNEVDEIHKLNGIIIKIYRPDKEEEYKHISEYGIKNIKNYDLLIINDKNKKNLYNKIDILYKNNNFSLKG
jgi:hypothetical protein